MCDFICDSKIGLGIIQCKSQLKSSNLYIYYSVIYDSVTTVKLIEEECSYKRDKCKPIPADGLTNLLFHLED